MSDQFIRYAPDELDPEEFIDRQMQVMPVRVRGAADADAEAAILQNNQTDIAAFAARTQQQHDLTGGHRSFFQQKGDLRFTYVNTGNQPIVYVDVNAPPVVTPPMPSEEVETPVSEEVEAPEAPEAAETPEEPEAAPQGPSPKDIRVTQDQLFDNVFDVAKPPGGTSMTDDAIVYDISPGELQLPLQEPYLGGLYISSDYSNINVQGEIRLRGGRVIPLPINRSVAIVFSDPIDPVPGPVQEQIGYMRLFDENDLYWVPEPEAAPTLFATAVGYLNKSGEFKRYPEPLPLYEMEFEVVMAYDDSLSFFEPASDTTQNLEDVSFILGPDAVEGVDYYERVFFADSAELDVITIDPGTDVLMAYYYPNEVPGTVSYLTIVLFELERKYYEIWGTFLRARYILEGRVTTEYRYDQVDAGLYFAATFSVGDKTLLDAYGYVYAGVYTDNAITRTTKRIDAAKISTQADGNTAQWIRERFDSRDYGDPGFIDEATDAARAAAVAQTAAVEALEFSSTFSPWPPDPTFAAEVIAFLKSEEEITTTGPVVIGRDYYYHYIGYDLFSNSVPFAQKPVSLSLDEAYDLRPGLSDPYDPVARSFVGAKYIPDEAFVSYNNDYLGGDYPNTDDEGLEPFENPADVAISPIKISVRSFAAQADSDSSYPSDTAPQSLTFTWPAHSISYNPTKDVASE